jgi:predicted enzyme related to lactoylglutathione lyase
MKKVTGIGGVFFKTDNPEKIREWYQKHLGLITTQWGATFFWHPTDNISHLARTEWSPFKKDTDYFNPSDKPFMINYRVENLTALLEQLKQEGVEIVGEMQEFDYGKFAWIMDPDGNKLELWEPVDEVLNNINNEQGMTDNN